MSKRTLRILIVVAIVLVAGYLGFREAIRSMHVSFGYCVEAEFESLPMDDQALENWLKEQPGVVHHTGGICRGGPGNKTLRVMFIQVHRVRERPVDLNEACARLGYVAKERFRDNHENCECHWNK